MVFATFFLLFFLPLQSSLNKQDKNVFLHPPRTQFPAPFDKVYVKFWLLMLNFKVFSFQSSHPDCHVHHMTSQFLGRAQLTAEFMLNKRILVLGFQLSEVGLCPLSGRKF